MAEQSIREDAIGKRKVARLPLTDLIQIDRQIIGNILCGAVLAVLRRIVRRFDRIAKVIGIRADGRMQLIYIGLRLNRIRRNIRLAIVYFRDRQTSPVKRQVRGAQCPCIHRADTGRDLRTSRLTAGCQRISLGIDQRIVRRICTGQLQPIIVHRRS